MEDLHLVQSLQASDNLDENFPNLVLRYVLLLLLVSGDLLKQVTIVRVLHDDADKLAANNLP